MPGTRCTVFSCNNSLLKTGKTVRYHRFPRDKKIRILWEQKCGRVGIWNPFACHVCSVHFAAESYERDLKSELLGLPPKRKLKKCAIPTLKLPRIEYDESTSRLTQYEDHLKEITGQQLIKQEEDDSQCEDMLDEIIDNSSTSEVDIKDVKVFESASDFVNITSSTLSSDTVKS